jgi:hypothetical protein
MATKREKKLDKPLHYLRQWREYRNVPEGTMTQDKLGELAKTSGSVIHLLETFQRGLDAQWAHRLAGPLRTRPGYLFDVNPFEQPIDFLDVWANIEDESKPQAGAVLGTFPQKRAKGA